MRNTAKIIHAMLHYSKIKHVDKERLADTRLVLYLSILDEYIILKGEQSLYISPYTFSDENEMRLRNMRVRDILSWYPHMDWQDAPYQDEMMYICHMLDDKRIEHIDRVYYQFCANTKKIGEFDVDELFI